MKGRPLVLIGVNGDEDRSAAKRVATEEGINWRSFWDGGGSTGIAAKWSVHAWPTVYLVDANGVVRDGGPRVGRSRSTLDKAVEDLVAEAEAKRPRSG
jgi:hypothetical protein